MKKIVVKYFVLGLMGIVLSAAFFQSCKKNNTGNTPGGYYVNANVDNVSLKSTKTAGLVSGPYTVLSGYQSPMILSIVFSNKTPINKPIALGDSTGILYIPNALDTANSNYYGSTTSGTLTITNYNKVDSSYTGTFSGSIVYVRDQSTTKMVTNGTFHAKLTPGLSTTYSVKRNFLQWLPIKPLTE